MLPRRINLVTLGVIDVVRSRAFYERLGFVASGFESDEVAFFDMNGTVFGIFGRAALAEDAGVDDAECSFRGVSLAINFASKAEVDAALAHARTCGGRIVQPAREVFWGGYSGYFADPDGHLWEFAYNPVFGLDEAGQLKLPPANVERQ
ncbi:MAG: VOC family protein [Alphaproteobacteria bacterium]|nr:VOC family protein [Alphaproteobacteria bacterium]